LRGDTLKYLFVVFVFIVYFCVVLIRFMKKIKIVFLFALLSLSAFAQRQTQGRVSVEGYGGYGPPMRTYGFGVPPDEFEKSAPSVNGGAAVSLYDYSGRIVVGFDYLSLPRGYHEPALYDRSDRLISSDFNYFYKSQTCCLYAGYMYRLWATRSRNFIVSCGGYLDVGVSICKDLSNHISQKTNTNEKTLAFTLGLTPDVQLEFFPLPSASLFMSVRSHITLLNFLPGYSNLFHPVGCLGVKYYL